MSKLRVNAFSVSIDGFGAGPDQGRDQPLGRGGLGLHQWFLPTRTFQRSAGLLDEMHLAISPILLGQGEPLFEGIDLSALGYRVKEHAAPRRRCT